MSASTNADSAGDKLYSALKKDEKETLTLLQLAADAGHAAAQYTLGKMHRAGKGVRRNDAKALHYFQMAGSQGHKKALCNVGAMYETGRGVQKRQKCSKVLHESCKGGRCQSSI